MSTTTGKYAVPAEIRALKPTDVDCIVKKISGKYYVYSRKKVDDPKHPGRKKTTTDRIIGKIEDGRYIPNDPLAAEAAGKTKTKTKTNKAQDSDFELLTVNAAKDYGAYAVAMTTSTEYYNALVAMLGWDVATPLYLMALIWAVRGLMPAHRVSDAFEASILSGIWTSFSEKAMKEEGLLDLYTIIARHRITCAKFEQALIDEGSGTYAIVRQVIPYPAGDELANFGGEWGITGRTKTSHVGVYDLDLDRPVATVMVDGQPNAYMVKTIFDWYHFSGSLLLVDMGFYSEDNLELFRRDDCEFVVPLPHDAILSRAAHLKLGYTNVFTFECDEDGEIQDICVIYREYKVSELEDIWQAYLDEETRVRREAAIKAAEAMASGEERDAALAAARDIRASEMERSTNGDDRVLVCCDDRMRGFVKEEFWDSSMDHWDVWEPHFGIICLRTNSKRGVQELYRSYKRRWQVQTQCDRLCNGAEFDGFIRDNWYEQQGAAYVLTVSELVRSSIRWALRASRSRKIKRMSVGDCIERVSRAKMVLGEDDRWHCAVDSKDVFDLLRKLGVDVAGDLDMLDSCW